MERLLGAIRAKTADLPVGGANLRGDRWPDGPRLGSDPGRVACGRASSVSFADVS